MLDTPDLSELIEDAARRLAGRAVQTPLLSSSLLNQRVGGEVFLKAENLQHIGAFKFRGAYVALSRLSPEERSNGVVAWSSGNHAQGVAAAARLFGISATIVMPHDAPMSKRQRTEALGARVVAYDRYSENREDIAAALIGETGGAAIPPYDHIDVISGQGTVGLEISRQLETLKTSPDQIVVPCGGGGRTAGIATAIRHRHPSARIIIAEPQGFEDTCRSLTLGERQTVQDGARSMCDALQAPTPGAITFDINRQLLSGGVAVPDADVADAMRFAFEHLKLVLEPGGAIALAAILNGSISAKGMTTAVVLTGGNVDPDLFSDVLKGVV
ncbi:MAG: threonine/serine dehydratase [Candidatus Phaeomarinobacter sp.]